MQWGEEEETEAAGRGGAQEDEVNRGIQRSQKRGETHSQLRREHSKKLK